MSKASIIVKPSEERCDILLDGRLTIQRAKVVKEKLQEALAFSLPIHLNLAAVSSVDVTFIQLSIALKKALEAQAKSLTISWPSDKGVLSLLENSGIIKLYQYV